MHIPLTFQHVIKRLFIFQTSFTLLSIPTNQPQYILFKNNNSRHSITYHSYFYHLFPQLLLQHSSHATNSISIYRPSQLISPSFHPSILAPCPLHLTSCKQHTSIILFLSSSQTSPFPLRLPKFHVPTCTPKRQSGLSSYRKQCLCAPGCGLHLPLYGRQVPPTKTLVAVSANNNWIPWGFFELDALHGTCPCSPQSIV